MKTGFSDPVKDGTKTKRIKNPWDFTSPAYDERSSCFVEAGTSHGVGHKQPVGHTGNPKKDVACLPRGKVRTMEVDEKG
jgi:hypothetical protein